MDYSLNQQVSWFAGDVLVSARKFLVTVANHEQAGYSTKTAAQSALEALGQFTMHPAPDAATVTTLRAVISTLEAAAIADEFFNGFLVERYLGAAIRLVALAKTAIIDYLNQG